MTSNPHFLTSISHELKNQIVPIFSLSEMIKDQCFGDIDDIRNKPEYLEAAQDIYIAAQDMLELLNDLMDIGADDHGEEFSIKLEEVDVADLIRRSIRINKDLALRKNIQIIFDNELETNTNNKNKDRDKNKDKNKDKDKDKDKNKKSLTSPTQIKLDPRRTKQVLINLISNSIKYSPEHTKITLSLNTNPSNNLIISIQDQGIGMTKEQIKMALQGQGSKIDKTTLQEKMMTNQDHHYQTQTNHSQAQQAHYKAQSHDQAQTTNQTQSQDQTQQYQLQIHNHIQTQHHDQTQNHQEQTQATNQTQSKTQTQYQYQIDSHGIGMPLVKRLVELQNGKIEILSEIGQGTKVVLGFGY